MGNDMGFRRRFFVLSIVCFFLLLATSIFTRINAVGSASSPLRGAMSHGIYPSGSQVLLDDEEVHSRISASDWTRKFDRYDLNETQCSFEFQPLFAEIERAVAHRVSIGNVNEDDIDLSWTNEGAVRAMIYNHKLYVLECKVGNDYMTSRILGTLQQINRAMTMSQEAIPNIEFSFVVSDIPDSKHYNRTVWSLSRMLVDEAMWLMPDFGYWSWPLDLIGNYEQVRGEISANERTWEDKVPEVLWRGAVKTNKIRRTLLQMTRGFSWADVQNVEWKNRKDVSTKSSALAIPMVDHCNNRFLIHTEGRSYSGRDKYLLNCRSVTIVHERRWLQPHHSVFVSSGPDQNIVEVKRDFSDLDIKVRQLLEDGQLAASIANNSANTFRDRYLTPAAQACYWRQLFRAWAEVSFRPKPWILIDGKRQLRGVPFETFVMETPSTDDKHCPLWRIIISRC